MPQCAIKVISPLGFSALLVLAILLPPAFNLSQYWLNNPLYGYGFFMPVMALFLAHRRWEGLKGVPRFPWISWAVVAGYFLSLPLLRIVQIANPDWRLIDWVLACGAVSSLLALAYMHGGSSLLRRIWFPCLFLLLSVPWPMNAENRFTHLGIPLIAKLTNETLWMIGIPTSDFGTTLNTPVGLVSIAEDCGGIRSFQLALVATLFWGAVFRLRKGPAVLLVAMGLAIGCLVNLLRITALVGIAFWSGKPDLLESGHDLAGLLAQLLLMASLPATAWYLSRQGTPPETPAEPSPLPPSPPWTPKPAIVIALFSWVAIVEIGSVLWFKARENPTASPRLAAIKKPDIPAVTTIELPELVRRNYRFSDATGLTWNDSRKTPWTMVWLAFDPGDLSACTHNVHRPEVCLPNANFVRAAVFPALSVSLGGVPVEFKHELYRRGRESLHLFYTNIQDSDAAAPTSRTDWTYPGRLRAAWLGIRSRRADLIHLTVAAPYSAAASRQLVTGYLEKLAAKADQ